MPFDAMRLRRAGAVAYPLALTVANPGAETGDTSGWTQNIGTGFSVDSANTASRGFSGTYHFILSSNIANAEVNQAVDLPAAAYTDIDAGTVALSASYLCKATNTVAFDWGTSRVEFWSGSGGTGTFLGQRTEDKYDTGTTVTRSLSYPVPPGTRSVVVFMFGLRNTGTELSFYFDDVALTLTKPGTTNEVLWADRGALTSGWTITTGSGQPTTNNTWANWTGWPGLTPGSLAAWQGYREINVSALSAGAQAAIAAGTATLFLSRYAWNENDDDQSRTWIECYNGGSVVATVQDVASPAAHVSGATVHLFNAGSVAVPSTTTKFRLNLHFVRSDGTVLDAAVGFVDSHIRW